MDKINFLICKFTSSAVIDNDENMYFWGDYFDGFKIRVPERVVNFEDKLQDMSFGVKHALALVGSKVYAWGDGTYGELGLGKRGS